MEVLKSHKAGVGGSSLAAKKASFDMRLRGVAYVPYCTFFLFSNLIDTSCISLTVIYVSVAATRRCGQCSNPLGL